jgi:hypothetical protein
MDPYLEESGIWSGFHLRLIVAISSALQKLLPKGLYVDIDEHVWLRNEEEGDERTVVGRPDVFVADRTPHVKSRPPSRSGVLLAEPTTRVVVPRVIPQKMRFLKVVETKSNQIITAIELLSPGNKSRGRHYDAYVAKREEYLAGRTSLVEIDLLRAGVRMPFYTDTPPVGDYYLFVSHAEWFPNASLWAFTVKDPIPSLDVPLRTGDESAVLDLNSLVHATYDENRYFERIDYSVPPSPRFRGALKDWAERRIARISNRV